MNTYAIVINGAVENLVLWDGNANYWSPPSGSTAVLVPASTGAISIGWTYSGGQFSAP